ncbi:MAG: hypothetical protein V4601_04565 [Pseudomonadota bacterium]
MKSAAFCCGLLLLISGSVCAQEAVPALTPSDEFIRLFSSYCLDKFPDDAAVASATTDNKLTKLSSEEASLFVRSKAGGEGWLIQGAGGRYVLTAERPPYHACTIRHAVLTPFSTEALNAMADKFVAAKGNRLVDGASTERPMGDGIASAMSYRNEVNAKGVPTGEIFMFAVVGYPGTAGENQPKQFWEVRFSRVILRSET